MAQKSSRKRRRELRERSLPASVEQPSSPARGVSAETPAPGAEGRERGYARGRAKDEAIRRSLKPLPKGERPGAVTAGAVAAALLALANVIATIAGWDGGAGSDGGQRLIGSLLVAAVLLLVAYGMWNARYWAVLGMQTLLAITLVISSLALITATSILAAVILVALIAGAGVLFWYLVKAMARIQMPERPGSSGR